MLERFAGPLRAVAARAHRVGLLIYAKAPRILIYHSIVRSGSVYAKLFPGMYVEEHVFAQSMAYVRKYCHPFSLSDFLSYAEAGRQYPSNAVVLTFDDGYANNYFRAAPLLAKYGIPGTFFITTGYVDGEAPVWTAILDRYFVHRDSMPDPLGTLGLPMRWTRQTARRVRSVYSARLKTMAPDARQAAINHLALSPRHEPDTSDAVDVLNWDQLRELSRLPEMTVAPHTVSHPMLAQLPDDQAENEIAESYQRLREQGISAAPYFAYPFGAPKDYTLREIDLVKKIGFRCALGTHPGLVTDQSDLFSLPRYEGKNDLTRFICHASGLQCILSRMAALSGRSKIASGPYGEA
ncbi:MAG: polysaccharide deacetylase family protein [Nitrospirota bacterium]